MLGEVLLRRLWLDLIVFIACFDLYHLLGFSYLEIFRILLGGFKVGIRIL